MTTLTRFRGCIIGCAAGDAVGAPVEFTDTEVCQTYLSKHVRPLNFKGVVREYEGPWPFGQYTDDTQLFRELLISIRDSNGFDPEGYADRIVSMFLSIDHGMVGSGRATQSAAMKLIEGEPWTLSGSPAPMAGNGSAMRAAPIGMLHAYAQDTVQLIKDAQDQSRITHSDPRAIAGSVVMALATYQALQDELLPAGEFCRVLSESVRKPCPVFAEGLDLLGSQWIHEELGIAAVHIGAFGGDPGYSGPKWEGISGFVLPSVLWSVYSFLRTPSNFMETICTSIYPGGDVDTTGAMAGALSGAYNGLGAIPKEMVTPLTDRGAWGPGDLMELVTTLARDSS